MHRYVRSIFWVFLIGCSSAVSINQYSVEYTKTSSTRTPVLSESVGIENFSCVNSILHHEILLRKDTKNVLEYSNENFWWELPRDIVTETFKNYLESKKLFTHVLPYPTLHGIKYIIEGKVHKFEIQEQSAKWSAVASVEIYLIDAETQKILWKSNKTQKATLCEATVKDAAGAMEKTIEKIYEDIFEKLQQQLIKK